MLKEEKEFRSWIRVKIRHDFDKGEAATRITALVRAVREDERKVMQDPKSWPDWKIAFASDVYGVPVDKMSAAIRGRK